MDIVSWTDDANNVYNANKTNPLPIASQVGGASVSASNGLPIIDGYLSPVSATWTSGTATNTALSVTTNGYDVAVISIVATAPVSAGHVTYEIYDGAAWLPIKIFPMDSYASVLGTTLNGTLNNAWQADLAGFAQFRVRLDTPITGAGSVKVTIAVTSAPAVPGVTAGLDPTATNPVTLQGTTNVTLLASAAQTVTANSGDQTNTGYRGVKVVVNVTAVTGTGPSMTVTIQGKDAASGVYYNMLASAAITATGTTVLTVYPGLTNSANVMQSDVLPATWRVLWTITGTTPSFTMSVGASLEI